MKPSLIALFFLLALAAASAKAQRQSQAGLPANTDGPLVTAPHTSTAPPVEPAPSRDVDPIARTGDAPAADPDTRARPTAPRTQLFISPMGEPFRAPQGAPYPVDAWFAKVDANGDGVLTREEFRADAARVFKLLDANGDGVIDGFEVQDYEARVVPEILPQLSDGLTAQDVMTQQELAKTGHRRRREQDSVGSLGGGRGEGGLTGGSLYGLLPDPEPVRSADSNLDYRITLKEWMAAADRRFDLLDTAHNGRVARAGLPLTPWQKMVQAREKAERKARK